MSKPHIYLFIITLLSYHTSAIASLNQDDTTLIINTKSTHADEGASKLNLSEVRANIKPLLGKIIHMDEINKQICGPQPKKNAPARDVHSYNAMFKTFSPSITQINQLMGLKTNYTLAECLEHLRKMRIDVLKEPNTYCENELGKLEHYLSRLGQMVEPETNTHPVQLLSSMVDYLEKTDEQLFEIAFFLSSLEENTKAGGGCYPGYIGRILACNVAYILRHLRDMNILT